MIKRLYNIARSNVSHFFHQRRFEVPVGITNTYKENTFDEADFQDQKEKGFETVCQSLASYYANLEIRPGSTREEVKAAWKRLMRKYHPDLHSTDPEKRETANELTRRLTESYQVLDKELMNKG